MISVDGKAIVDSGGNLGSLMPNVLEEGGDRDRRTVLVRFSAQQALDGGAKYIDVFVDGRRAFRNP